MINLTWPAAAAIVSIAGLLAGVLIKIFGFKVRGTCIETFASINKRIDKEVFRADAAVEDSMADRKRMKEEQAKVEREIVKLDVEMCDVKQDVSEIKQDLKEIKADIALILRDMPKRKSNGRK